MRRLLPDRRKNLSWCDIFRLNARGQMAVELAALIPTIIVVALISYNLGNFVVLSARFDRVAPDAIVSQGVAPAGQSSTIAAVDAIRGCVEEAMGQRDRCAVEVFAERMESSTQDARMSISPFLTKFTCVLVYRPWPSALSFAGVFLGSPVELRHERSLVVDCYRAGVVV